ncbi:acyltransferase family protein [Nocardioides sp. T2.26MG-1]|uniref:acyltransferase family protein n=1 Tax=Nocardioides sp. T2.26MG-1 TaxID=3041166 RepID=UPI00247769D4|nr:acyltransferase [Nocardioides sp. T2.26MG-1]CAI9419916.1 hypothetical protein HIDPHFAB_03933 [Nocardioides sp. T2.26MG-1]
MTSPSRAPSLGADIVPPPPATSGQYVVLDTLRAVGALGVLTTHTSFQSGAYVTHGTWGTMLARLDVGVAIFFVLSGFLLSRPFLDRGLRGERRPSTGQYLWKRFLRIAPVYVLAVLVALTFIHENADLGAGQWLTTLAMLNTFVDPTLPYGLTHMWSLAVEVTFYVALPALMLLAIGRRRLRPARVTAVLVVLSAVSVWWHLDGAGRVAHHTEASPLQWLPTYLIWFAIGIGLALVSLLHADAERGTRPGGRIVAMIVGVGRQPGVCWTIALGLFLVAATPLAGPSVLAPLTSAQSLTKNLLYAGIGGLLVASGAFSVEGGRYQRVFGHVSLRRLGWISYSVFSLHMSVIQLVMWATGWPLFGGHALELWALTLVASLVVADLTYRLIERPALRLKTLPLGRRQGTQASADTTGTSRR